VRTVVAAAVVASIVFAAGLPAADASQADLDRARRPANAAANELFRAQSRLSNVQAELAAVEAEQQEIRQRLGALEGTVRAVAIAQFIRGGRGTLPTDFDPTDASVSTRASALAGIVTAGSDDAVDAFRAAAEDLAIAEARLVSVRKSASDALATYRQRASVATAELRRMQTLEAERIAREKAQRAAAARRPRGSNAGLVLGSGNWICPVQGPRAFGNDFGDPRGGGRRRHQGNDILAPRGTPVVAPVSGMVRQHNSSLGGLSFYLNGSDGIVYFGTHLNSYGASGRVSAGTVVGTVGTTGNASGGPPHLHFEMHPGGGGAVNPYPTLRQYC